LAGVSQPVSRRIYNRPLVDEAALLPVRVMGGGQAKARPQHLQHRKYPEPSGTHTSCQDQTLAGLLFDHLVGAKQDRGLLSVVTL
jgi:hypothetical protein